MAKYEIMLVLSATVDEKVADENVKNLISKLNADKVEQTKHGVRELAYEIKKQKQAYYYQLNLETEDAASLEEFRRLARINKLVLRNLIINLEKDYGYRASVNPKKIKRNEKRAEVYVKRQEEYKRIAEERQAAYEAKQAANSQSENN